MAAKLKQHLPRGIRYGLWFLFKSPQRQLGYLPTWFTELRGYISLRRHNSKPLQPVTICTGIKDRTENYLQYTLPSILKMQHRELVSISIYDCGSADLERLKKELREKWGGKLSIRSEKREFTRAFSFNKAIEQASGPIIFAADADMSLPPDLVELCNRYVSKRSIWFPICFDLKEGAPAEATPENGRWRTEGKGMFAATKEQFRKTGGYDERFDTWGGEDWNLWLRFYKAGLWPVRNLCKGLFHHYHPSRKPADYNKGYGLQ